MIRDTLAKLRTGKGVTYLVLMVIITQSATSIMSAWTPDPEPDYTLEIMPSVIGCNVFEYPQTETNILVNGTAIDTGEKHPARDPLKWWVNCFSYQISGTPKLVPIFFNLALMPLVYLLTLQLTKDKLISLLAFVAFFENPLYHNWINSGTYDQVWSFFLILSVYITYRYKSPLASLISLGVSLMSKPLGILYIPSILYGLKVNKTWYTKYLILSVIGITIISLLIGTIVFPVKLSHLLGGTIAFHPENLHHALFDNFGMLVYEIPFLMILGYVSWKYSPKQPSSIRKLAAIWIVNSWLTTTIIYLFSNQFQFVYRFVPLAVFMSIFIAITINDLGKWYIEYKLNQVDKK